jgi:hypothetical protein
VAALDEADAVLGELAEGVDHGVDGVHGGRARSPRLGARAWEGKPTENDALLFCGIVSRMAPFL